MKFLRISWIRALAAAGIALLAGVEASAQDKPFANATVIPLKNGINSVDLDADGITDAVVVWETPYLGTYQVTVFAFLRRVPDPLARATPVLIEVPFFDRPDDIRPSDLVRAVHAPDCLLREVYLVRDMRSVDGRPTVIRAEREIEESHALPGKAKFHVYHLTVVPEQERDHGDAIHYYRRVATIETERPYCNVDEAAMDELGIALHGRPHRTFQ